MNKNLAFTPQGLEESCYENRGIFNNEENYEDLRVNYSASTDGVCLEVRKKSLTFNRLYIYIYIYICIAGLFSHIENTNYEVMVFVYVLIYKSYHSLLTLPSLLMLLV